MDRQKERILLQRCRQKGEYWVRKCSHAYVHRAKVFCCSRPKVAPGWTWDHQRWTDWYPGGQTVGQVGNEGWFVQERKCQRREGE